jgi:4-amino-4-deoxy-L-arabinose transferase-like glycosyltransferase
MGIMPQDAYYYLYAQHLALSYYDHPPMVGWMLWLFTGLLGKSIIAVHVTDFIITLSTVWVVWLLAKRMLPAQKATHALFLFFSTAMVGILSIITTPDVPLLLFWSLSLVFAHKAITNDKWQDWMLTGVIMGAAFLSKYTAVFLPAGLLLFLLLSKHHKIKIFNYRFILVCLSFAIVSMPVVLWNMQNNFISFRFQSGERFSQINALQLKPQFLLGTVGHQMFIILPVLFIALWLFVWKYARRGWKRFSFISINYLFLLCFFLPMVFFFFGISLFYWVKINWMMPAYISGIIWAAIYLSKKWIQIQLVVSLVVQALGLYVIAAYPVPVRSDDTWWGWNKLNEQVDVLLQSRPGYFLAAYDENKTAAVLQFTSNRKVYSGTILGRSVLQYNIIDKEAPQQLKGKDGLLFDSQPRFTNEYKSDTIPDELKQHFESITELEPILILNSKGKVLRKFLVFECKNYQP